MATGSPSAAVAALPADSTDPLAKFLHVPLKVSAEAIVTGLTVRELFRLDKGSIVTTSQSSIANLPLYAGKKLIAWGEFQVVGTRLAFRVGELA